MLELIIDKCFVKISTENYMKYYRHVNNKN